MRVHPRRSRLLAGLSRHCWSLSAIVAVFFAVTVHTDPPDMADFARAGGQLLTGHLDQVYAGAWNQAGPLQLLVSWLLDPGGGPGPNLLTRIVVDLAIIAAARGFTLRQGAKELATNTTAVMTTLWLGPWGFWAGHPAEPLLIPLLWVGAAIAARDRRWVRAGLLLGGAAAVAPWGVLAAPVLLGGGLAIAAGASMVAIAFAVAVYVPFVATGRFAMFDHVWPISPYSLVHLIDPSAQTFDWPMRVVQAALVAGGCAVTTLALRGRREAVVLAPLLVAGLRVATDPLGFDYYWLPVGAAALIALVYARPRNLRQLVALMAFAYTPWLATTLSGTSPTVPVYVSALFVLALGAHITLLRRDRTLTASLSSLGSTVPADRLGHRSYSRPARPEGVAG